MKHQHLERHLRAALDGHGVLLRSTVITREDTTGDWELTAVWGAPSDAALRQLIAEDLDVGHIPDGWGRTAPPRLGIGGPEFTRPRVRSVLGGRPGGRRTNRWPRHSYGAAVGKPG